MVVMIIAIVVDATFLALDAFYQRRRMIMFTRMVKAKSKEMEHIK